MEFGRWKTQVYLAFESCGNIPVCSVERCRAQGRDWTLEPAHGLTQPDESLSVSSSVLIMVTRAQSESVGEDTTLLSRGSVLSTDQRILLTIGVYYRSHLPSCRLWLGFPYLSLAGFLSELQTCGVSEPLGMQIPSSLVADKELVCKCGRVEPARKRAVCDLALHPLSPQLPRPSHSGG